MNKLGKSIENNKTKWWFYLVIFLTLFLSYFLIFPFIFSLIYKCLNLSLPKIFPLNKNNVELISFIIQYLGGLLIILIAFLIFKPQRIFKKFFNSYTLKHSLITVGLIYLVNFIISFLLLGILKENQNQETVNNLIVSYPILAFFGVVIIAPLVEEILFRFLLVTPIKRKNQILAIAISGLVFGSLHLVASIEGHTFLQDLPSLTIYVGCGCVLAYRYIKTGSLAVTIQAHMINNFLAFLLSFVPEVIL